jgi:hypothetical protein
MNLAKGSPAVQVATPASLPQAGQKGENLQPAADLPAPMNVDATSLEEMGLLECLHAIAHGEELAQRSHALRDRLIEAGLAVQDDDGLSLTPAGIERCRSLQHRVASDREAQKMIDQRDAGSQEASSDAGQPSTSRPSMIVVAQSVSAELNEIRKSDDTIHDT